LKKLSRPTASRRLTGRLGATRWLLLGFGFALFSATQARAATLDVIGPPGAEVSIDGSARGLLPLARPLVVDPGERFLEVRLGGHVTHREAVEVVSRDQSIRIEIELVALSRVQAMGSSAVLAGLGQLYQGRRVTGWSMMALQVGAWGWLFWADDQYKVARDDYLTAINAYERATDRDAVRAARQEAEALYGEIDDKNSMRSYATVAVIAIGAWSVFDAWRQHDRFYEPASVELPIQTAVTRGVDGTQVEVGWQWNF